MNKQESSVIKRTLENLIELISYTIEDLLEKLMYFDSRVGNENDYDMYLIKERVRQIHELNEEFIHLAEEISKDDMSYNLKKEKIERFLQRNKRYRHLNKFEDE